MTNSGQQVIVAWGAELVRSGGTAGAEQAGQFLVYFHCTLETVAIAASESAETISALQPAASRFRAHFNSLLP
jgi:hypothetical protein